MPDFQPFFTLVGYVIGGAGAITLIVVAIAAHSALVEFRRR